MDIFLQSPSDYWLTRWLFLRLLGCVYLIAFASFGIQATGLVGEEGILPASAYLAAVRRALGRKGYLYYPTLFWINSSDRALQFLCLSGAILGLLLTFGLQTTPVLVLLWLGYLSLVTIGQVFLSYQWDALLLEAGFLAIFLVPPSLLPSQAQAPPSPILILLLRWLLFRLMFMSGILKLASGDPTWRSLTALTYHYETQPLPTPLAWFAHRAPFGFHKFSTLVALLVEILVPFLYFATEPFRLAAGLLTVFLQVLILLTGNFAFFNLLTIILLVPLLSDAVYARALPVWLTRLAPPLAAGAPGWADPVLIPLAVLIGATGALFLLQRLSRSQKRWNYVQPWIRLVIATRLVNSYGLFTVMTTQRPEIVVEGSDDGENWSAYEFKYKPGDLKRPPPLVAPHQPRLDWQMWFAALGTYSENPWFLHFAERLLENAPQVTRLLAHNPFPDHPPRYIRATLYDYHFSDYPEKKSGFWWRRSRLGFYMTVVSLEQ